MRGRAKQPYWGTVLEAPDADALATFYSALLDWPVVTRKPGWCALKPPDGVVYVAVQESADFVPPVWPPVAGRQQMTMHLDIEVDDLVVAVEDAVALGARVADVQPQDDVRVLIDPAGHPFCLYLDTSGES